MLRLVWESIKGRKNGKKNNYLMFDYVLGIMFWLGGLRVLKEVGRRGFWAGR